MADSIARPIRSFVRREGRLTPGQQRALDRLWPRFGLDYDGSQFDFDAVFGRHAERVLEIGFGNGESLAEQAAAHPELDFIGVEVHRPGVGRLLQLLESRGIGNVRTVCTDAVEVVSHAVPDAALRQISVFFPDPWPKKRHHKRRLLQPAFIELLARKLDTGGVLHVATDWADYADHIGRILQQADTFGTAGIESALARPETRFEQRGVRKGHAVFDMVYRRRS